MLSVACGVLQKRLCSIELLDLRPLVTFALFTINWQSSIDLSSVVVLH